MMTDSGGGCGGAGQNGWSHWNEAGNHVSENETLNHERAGLNKLKNNI